MADNKMTEEKAVELMRKDANEITNEELAQVTKLFHNFDKERLEDQDVGLDEMVKASKDATKLAEARIAELVKEDEFSSSELNGIIALAESVSMFSENKTQADAILNKAQKQKDDIKLKFENLAKNAGNIDENISNKELAAAVRIWEDYGWSGSEEKFSDLPEDFQKNFLAYRDLVGKRLEEASKAELLNPEDLTAIQYLADAYGDKEIERKSVRQWSMEHSRNAGQKAEAKLNAMVEYAQNNIQGFTFDEDKFLNDRSYQAQIENAWRTEHSEDRYVSIGRLLNEKERGESAAAKLEELAQKQAKLDAASNEGSTPITIDENTGDEQVLENNQENVDEISIGLEEEQADASKQETQEQQAEAETPIQETPQEENTDSTEENTEEVEFPERREITKKEFPAMLDPLSEDMPEMTKDERARQEERLEKVDELSENTEYQPEYLAKEGAENEPDPVYDTLKFTIEQGAVRKLTISEDEINEENLKKARAEEEERIALEYYNAIFGACKTDEELDKETPQEHVERLGKVADLVSQKKSRTEIYAAMGIQPTKDQEQIAANAVYHTNATPALEWAKKLGKAGLKYMDKYREFEKNNPMTGLGMGLAMTGNPFYKAARMALAARGLYKDYDNYKKNHPNEKHTFLGMLKDKEARKNLKNNAGIFIRSVPVVGQAYGVTMMAKQLGKTCKKGFWKDLGNKFKDAGKAWKEVAENPKDLSKWKNAAKKSQVPAAIVGGLALTAVAAYKGIETYNEHVEAEEQLKAEEALVAIENEKLEIKKELLIALPKEEEEVNTQEEHSHHTPRASHTPRTPSESAPAPKIEIDESKLEVSAPETTVQTPPENPEMATPKEVHDEKFYQDMKDSTKGLNNEAQDALKDPNKTVDEAVDKHYEDQAAKGNITESQADKAATAAKGNIGTLYGKSDEDLTAKDVKEGIKTTEKALDSAKENADEFITAEQVGKNVDASEEGNYVHRHQEEHPDGYSQNIESSEACKGMENACNRMLSGARHGQNIGSMMNEEMKAGNLSEEQATAMNQRWSELKHKGYSDERALSKMADDYHRIGNDYLKHQEYAAEHQNENAQTQTQQVEVDKGSNDQSGRPTAPNTQAQVSSNETVRPLPSNTDLNALSGRPTAPNTQAQVSSDDTVRPLPSNTHSNADVNALRGIGAAPNTQAQVPSNETVRSLPSGESLKGKTLNLNGGRD